MTWNNMRYEDVNWPIDNVFQDYWTFLVVDLYNLDIPLFSWGVKPRHWSFEFLLRCVTFVPRVVAHCDKKRRHELRLLGLQQEGPVWNLRQLFVLGVSAVPNFYVSLSVFGTPENPRESALAPLLSTRAVRMANPFV